MNAKSFLALLFWAAAALPAWAAQPIVAYVSPGQLFPVEGTAFMQRDEPARTQAYRPLAAYAQPGGQRIGEVALARPNCVGRRAEGDCADGLSWVLVTGRGNYRLETAEYSYETSALVSTQAPLVFGGMVWTRIDYAAGSFWVATRSSEVFEHEKLAHVLDDFDSWCAAPGNCAPVTKEMVLEAARVAHGEFALESCYSHAYEIREVVSAGAARYYRVALAQVEAGAATPNLPASGYVPVRNRDGTHTGTFYPRGC